MSKDALHNPRYMQGTEEVGRYCSLPISLCMNEMFTEKLLK